ncbi:hypothetical protein ACWER6_11960 [Streptomyces sp. NPDC004009]
MAPGSSSRLRAWGIDTAVAERLIEVVASLAAHAVSVDASLSAAEFDAPSLRAVSLSTDKPSSST